MALRRNMKEMESFADLQQASINNFQLFEKRCPSMRSLAVDVSGSCNLQCAYCAESMALPRREPMDMQTVIRSVEMLFNQSEPGSPVAIYFSSGEPLLQSELVKAAGKAALELAKAEERSLYLSLTTNGTLLTPQIIKWLMEDGWEVKVSLDGDRDVHDRFRTDGSGDGTYDRIRRHVRTLSQIIPERFSTTSVLCQGGDPAGVFDGIAGLGVPEMEMVPAVAPTGSSFLPGETELDSYRRFILKYAKRLLNSSGLPTISRFQKHLRRVMGLGNSQITCEAGRTFFAAGSDGNLYPCYRFIGMDKYKLGDIQSGIDREAARRFSGGCGMPSLEREKCKTCWAEPLCDGPCFAAVELFGEGSPPQGFCEMVQADCEAAIWLSNRLKIKNPQKLCQLAGIQL